MKERDGLIIWPEYMDAKLTRAEGRRIAANLCVNDPSANLLRLAAKVIGHEAEVIQGKRYPRHPSEDRGGYIVLENPQGHSKKRLLMMLAKGARKVVAKKKKLEEAKRKRKSRK
ncbi:MAG: signal recognition particle subunit SRP19/SEC65 family protein [Candidatus Thorarchaeota archaeon]|nr:signal recognition particle subunit SRP19/SEC65 family protein [Candidatus Thorarchaeota archaeon]